MKIVITIKTMRTNVSQSKRSRINDEFLHAANKVLNKMSNRFDTKGSSASKETEKQAMSSSRYFVESLMHDLDSLKGQWLISAKMRISQVIHEEIMKQMGEQ